jgi:hypothetical protein
MYNIEKAALVFVHRTVQEKGADVVVTVCPRVIKRSE